MIRIVIENAAFRFDFAAIVMPFGVPGRIDFFAIPHSPYPPSLPLDIRHIGSRRLPLVSGVAPCPVCGRQFDRCTPFVGSCAVARNLSKAASVDRRRPLPPRTSSKPLQNAGDPSNSFTPCRGRGGNAHNEL